MNKEIQNLRTLTIRVACELLIVTMTPQLPMVADQDKMLEAFEACN